MVKRGTASPARCRLLRGRTDSSWVTEKALQLKPAQALLCSCTEWNDLYSMYACRPQQTALRLTLPHRAVHLAAVRCFLSCLHGREVLVRALMCRSMVMAAWHS